ncbi:molybdate/tungstate transport system permease protein [Halogranum amylolyticum]|uniref:Molybdate/tungstate transport system permease protein n=1 Tax=Halogranum amylolyticum TaxID=660520 RepID=A0A1H8TNJ9_9EURY|nr:ABC transporter permease [Halogranum amylolyticum]SEO92630.1 molybdate/tungstate transport system permease protein [Halogranum amylolyticum]
MSTTTGGSSAAVDGTFGRGAVVLAVVTVQAVAFAAAVTVERPTLYALFALGSAAALVAASGGGWRGVAAALVGSLALAGVLWFVGSRWMLVLTPPLLTLAVGLGGDGDQWAGVAAATLGTVLLVALGLPLALFFVQQDVALVAEAAADPEVHRMLVLSVYAPLLAALAALVCGVPLAYLLREGFPGQSAVESLVDLPLVVPHSVAGLVVLFGFGRGAAFPEMRVLGTLTGMVLALTFVSAPFAVNAAREAFETVDRRLEFAARAHGASRFSSFLRVTLPLSARGIVTGGVMAWARAVSEFGAVAVVAYTVQYVSPLTLRETTAQHAPVYIFNTYTSQGLPESGAVATLLLGLSAGIFLLVRWLAFDDGGAP